MSTARAAGSPSLRTTAPSGSAARIARVAARTSLAASLSTVLGCDVPARQVFLTTSGPTGVGVAVQGLLAAGGPRRMVASAVESLAVLSPARAWADPGALQRRPTNGRRR